MKDEAKLFKALADPTRVRLAALLAIRGETCVCKLAQALGQPDFKISRHLGVLRASGMVEARREGTWMHYRLASPRSRLEKSLQAGLRQCLADHDAVKSDLARLDKAVPVAKSGCRA
ncbi:MAG: metalloregulator ArsR/SmtB family transcription factor [Planctomycetota bacterium]